MKMALMTTLRTSPKLDTAAHPFDQIHRSCNSCDRRAAPISHGSSAGAVSTCADDSEARATYTSSLSISPRSGTRAPRMSVGDFLSTVPALMLCVNVIEPHDDRATQNAP